MDNQIQNSIVSFIWGIADDCLRDVYVRGKYRDVILPMTVIRRLDAMLEDTKTDVLKMKDTMDKAGITNQWPALCNAADQAFCNASPFLLKDLTSRAKKQTLKADFEAYLDGFSPNVQEILEKFKFRNQIDTMIDADILGAVIEKFVSPTINLSPKPVYTDDTMTTIKLPALDNHGMGTIFEELIRKFNEENNEEAGEHWTPRDVVELMADLIIVPVADQIMDATYSCYDGACGTGGMLTVAQDRLLNIAKRRGKNVSIHLFGQEVQPETYAICKADMLLKGDGDQADHIAYGSTLSADGNATRQFDFMLANPPYGKSWKTDAEKMGGKKDILDSRFNAYLEDGTQLSMIPRTSDGQLLFLLNNVSKMKKDTPLGSRIAEVHNGSSIFTGDAGSGESNARRYLIENDLVEAIIALPENMFYNTGIGTFIWILSNKKEERRKGKIQLIDARLIPALAIQYCKENSFDFEHEGSTTSSFDSVKQFYLDAYEALGNLLVIPVALNNIKYRSDINAMNPIEKNVNSLEDYIKLTKASRYHFCLDSEVYTGFLKTLANAKLRNAIGHNDVEYNSVDQLITYIPNPKDRTKKKTEYLLQFENEAMHMFQAILGISEYLYRLRELELMYDGKIPIMVQERVKWPKKIGRNELCPCGSGKKYKRCHGR